MRLGHIFNLEKANQGGIVNKSQLIDVFATFK